MRRGRTVVERREDLPARALGGEQGTADNGDSDNERELHGCDSGKAGSRRNACECTARLNLLLPSLLLRDSPKQASFPTRLFSLFLPVGSAEQKGCSMARWRIWHMLGESCCAGRARGRAGRLSEPSGALGRAVSGRRTDRHAVAHPRRQARRAVGPERRGREQGRRLGGDRQRLRRQVPARRLHADPGHAEHARLQPDLLSQPALRSDQGLPAAHPDRHGLHGAGDGAQRAGRTRPRSWSNGSGSRMAA